jgi:hypothetical protein
MAAGVNNTIDGNVTIRGYTNPAGGIAIPANSVGDAQIPSGANIAATKLTERIRRTYDQPGVNTAATGRQRVHVVTGTTGTLIRFLVGAAVAGIGAATVTVKLLKNGTDILTSDLSLTSATAAYTSLSTSAFTSTSLAEGDVLEVQVSAVAAGGGTLPQGLYAEVVLDELPV